MEWEVALARELDIEPPNAARVEGIPGGAFLPDGTLRMSGGGGGSGVWAVDLNADNHIPSECVHGCSDVVALRQLANPILRTLGLQEASVDVQCNHLHSLITDAMRDGKTEEIASHTVHTALLSNYKRWCAYLLQPRRTAGVLEDCLLLLCVWGEAANLRHMPELLCWLFHQLLAHRDALLEQASSGNSSHGTTPTTVLCCSFLASVVRPLVDICKTRMVPELPVEQRLTYDDLNEFFW